MDSYIALLTELSRPSVINIRKNMMDQKLAPGRVARAAGYTENTRPGPILYHSNIAVI